jgi:hypothetical protein
MYTPTNLSNYRSLSAHVCCIRRKNIQLLLEKHAHGPLGQQLVCYGLRDLSYITSHCIHVY